MGVIHRSTLGGIDGWKNEGKRRRWPHFSTLQQHPKQKFIVNSCFLLPADRHLRTSSLHFPSTTSSSSFLLLFAPLLHFHISPLHGEHQEAGEGGVFPSSHQISSFQFEVGPVSFFHLDQNAIAGRLAGHILVASKG